MKTTKAIRHKLSNERERISQFFELNKNKEGVPIEITIDISIQEIFELSNNPTFSDSQKQYYKKKIKDYYKGQEMFGENRVLPIINQSGAITMWID
ncbi:hypothetical protein [Formosa haliotis]|uniref:hypothetical protein n=1 Tax=Formosa haliotis TaxID=1555194 RepID=UPI00082640DA|nr:hypothetical protein [Formosa haliotis]